MAYEDLGTGRVTVEADDRATAELERIHAEFEALMASLGRERAEVKIKADISDLRRKVDEAKLKLKELEAAERREAALNDTLSAQQKAASTRRLNGIRDEIAATKAAQVADTERVAGMRRELEQSRLIRQEASVAARERAAIYRADDQAARSRAAAAKRDLADWKAQHTAALTAIKDRQEIIRLQQRYANTQQKLQDLRDLPRFKRDQPVEKLRIKLDTEAAKVEMDKLREELRLKGARPIEQKIRVDDSGIKRFLRDFTGFGRNQAGPLDQVASAFSRLRSSVGGGRINIGPLSTSLKGLVVGFTLLSPLITGLLGGLGSLVSVVGAGLGGALGVGAAAMTGFGLATVGIMAEVKPLAQQFSIAHQALQKYSLAVDHYGAGSKQAKAAQAQLNNTMKAMPPLVRAATHDWAAASQEWHKLTDASAARNFGTVLHSTMQTARADMGVFARGTNQAFTAVSQGWSKWMAQLRSPGAKQALGDLMHNFAGSLGPVMSGLGHLGSAFGRVMVQFSTFLPGLGRGFDHWAASIDSAAKRSHGFASGVRTMVQAMQAFGHFAQAGAKWLLTFFGAGVGPGIGMLNDFTTALNRSSTAMKTTESSNIHRFFSEGAKTLEGFVSAFGPLLSNLAQFGMAMQPVLNVAQHLLTVFFKVVGVLAKNPFVQWSVGGLLAVAMIGRLTRGMLDAGRAAISLGRNLFKVAMTAPQMGLKNAFQAAFGGGTGAATGSEIGTAAVAEMEGAAPGIGTTIGSTAAAELEAALSAASAEIEGAGAAAGTEMASGIEGASAAAGGEIAGELTGAGAAIGGEIAGAMEAAGASVAGEIAAAMAGGGAAAAGRSALAGGAGALAGAGEAAAGATAAEGALAGEGAAMAGLASEAAVAAPEVAAVGGAAAGLAAPIAIAVAAGVGLAALLSSLGGGASDAQKAFDGYRQAVRAAADATASLNQQKTLPDQLSGLTQVAPRTGPRGADMRAVNSLQAEYNKLVAQGKTNTAQFAQVSSSLSDAIGRQHQETQQVNDTFKQLDQQNGQVAKHMSGDLTKALDGVNTAQKAVNDATSKYNEDLRNPHLGPGAAAADLKDRKAALNSLSGAQKAYNQVLVDEQQAEYKTSALVLSKQRVLVGQQPIFDQYASSVGRLVQQVNRAGDTKAMQFLIKAPNPADLAKISNTINHLAPKDQTAAIHILGDSKDAQQAIDAINHQIIAPKMLHILGDARQAAAAHNRVAALADVKKFLTMLGQNRDALSKHQQVQALSDIKKVLTMLGINTDALGKHGQVSSLPNIQKLLTIIGDASSALSAWNTISGAVHNITATITTVFQQVGHPFGGAMGGALNQTRYVSVAPPKAALNRPTNPATGLPHNFAATGFAFNDMDVLAGADGILPSLWAKQMRAADRAASMSVGRSTRGYKVTKPMYLVGEENRNEYVIATNPRYRENNRKYLQMAAHDLGMQVIPAATGHKRLKSHVAGQHAAHKGKHHSGPGGLEGKYEARARHHFADAFGGLAPVALKDRMGPVDTSDIAQTIQNEQSKLQTWNSANSSARSNKKSPPYSDSRIKALQNDIKKLQQFKGYADNAHQAFDNLETTIDILNDAMTYAQTSPDHMALYNGHMESFGWLQKVRQAAIQQHTQLLTTAVRDTKRILGRHPTSAKLKFEKALEKALGESIDEGQTNLTATVGTPPVISLEDYISSSGQWNTYQQLLAAQSEAQLNNVPDNPGTPVREDLVSQYDDLVADKQLMDFFSSVYTQSKKIKPVDYGLIKETSDAYASARNDYLQLQATFNGAAASAGPTQLQLMDTARAQMLSEYGSNTVRVDYGPPLTKALAGAVTAAMAMQGMATQAMTPSSGAAPQGSSRSTINITNNFAHGPADSHTWSQGIAWELGAAV